MKKKKRKKLPLILIALFIILIGVFIYFILNSKDNNSLTLEENQWIDSNKYNVIDIAIINDIPVISYNGEGFLYNYLDYVNEKHSLKFNVIPYKLDTNVDYDYKLDIVSKVKKDQINLYTDNLILITKDNKQYANVNDILNLKIGILAEDKDVLNNYFANKGITLVEYKTYSELKNSLEESATASESSTTVDGIIIPKLTFTKEIIEKNYKISYIFEDLNKYYVLNTKGDNELNSILKKDYNAWKDLNYKELFNSSLLNNYYLFKNISDTDQKKLQSKKYVYGFIDNGIYNYLEGNNISGFNGLILKDFKDFSGLSIKYTKYSSISKLLKDFNSGKVDFMMNIADSSKYNEKTYNTIGVFDKNLVIITGNSNSTIIDSIYSLKDKEVLTIKNSYLEKYLNDNGVKPISYNNMKDLTTDFKDNSIAIVDLENYNYYKTSAFKDSRINYTIDNNEKYNYVINNDNDNSTFSDIFNFYLNYNSIKELINKNYESISYKNIDIVYILVLIIIALAIYLVIDFSNHVKFLFKRIKVNKTTHLSKEDKIKYIDQLTSLKNRAYLNSKIEIWDDSEIYPQAVIVIDLNNISYINDNYGREEGDKVITEAANILIQHQLQNSEIIRTDGNEFLVYLVGYSEKQIVSYIRKLTKELKSLSHGFGAASGYSIITDAIKTFDDAVNEATLSMKENKEDIDY